MTTRPLTPEQALRIIRAAIEAFDDEEEPNREFVEALRWDRTYLLEFVDAIAACTNADPAWRKAVALGRRELEPLALLDGGKFLPWVGDQS